MSLPLMVVAGISAIVGALCLPSLWRKRCSVRRKALWSLILFFPVIGPVFYGGFYSIPPPKSEAVRRAERRAGISMGGMLGGGGGL